MAIKITEETHDRVTLSAADDTAILKGEIDVAKPGNILNPFFDKIKDQMDEQVRLDFTNLDFLNSSGIKCIVSFVMGKKPGSKVVFVVDSNKTWQETSLEVIQSLDEDNISIEKG